MEWTENVPTEQGWYICWRQSWNGPRLVKVYASWANLYMRPDIQIGDLIAMVPIYLMPYSWQKFGYPKATDLVGWWWLGPLDIPVPPKEKKLWKWLFREPLNNAGQ